MRSILWTLRRYQRKTDPVFINADELLRSSLNAPKKDLPPHVDKLYPKEIFLVYESVILGSGDRRYINPETHCDAALLTFMEQHDDYVGAFKQAITDKIKRLILLRAILASYSKMKGINKVPAKYRRRISNALGIRTRMVTKREAANMFDVTMQTSTIEEMILGRIGYLLLWKDL